MGRRTVVPDERNVLGTKIFQAMERLEMAPQEVAAAARLSKGTIYRILSGKTTQPRQSTLHKLCKVLCLDLAELMGSEQLDLLGSDLAAAGALSEIEELISLEIARFGQVGYTDEDRLRAGEWSLMALLDVRLGSRKKRRVNVLPHWSREAVPVEKIQKAVIGEFRKIPGGSRPAAAQKVLGALFDLRMCRGEKPSASAARPLQKLRRVLWRPAHGEKRE